WCGSVVGALVTLSEHANQLSLSSLGRDQHAESGPCEREQFADGHLVVDVLCRVLNASCTILVCDALDKGSLCLNHGGVAVAHPTAHLCRSRVDVANSIALALENNSAGERRCASGSLETGHCFLL